MTIQKDIHDEALGAQGLSTHSTGVSSALNTPTAGARAVLVQPVSGNVMVSFDGTVPSASYGFLLLGGQRYVFGANLIAGARAIGSGGTTTVMQQPLA